MRSIGAAGKTLIRCGRIIDGNGRVIPGADMLLVHGGAIEAIGDESAVAMDGSVTELNFPGCTLMPGLVNAHDHVLFRRATPPMATLFGRSETYQSIFGARNGALALAEGVTATRDMAAAHNLSGKLRDAVRRGMIPSPRMVSCLRAISRRGGPGSALSIAVENNDEALSAVDELAKDGADFIKVFASGDGSAESQPLLSPDTIARIVKRAAQYGLKVVAHANTKEAIRACIDAGVYCVEHGPELDQELAKAMAESGMWYTPTMSGFWVIGAQGEKWGRPPHVIRAFAAYLKPHVNAVRAALEAGVKMVVGTDSLGTMPMEIDLLSKAGVPAGDIVKAATSAGAELLGLADTGRLEHGARADLLILEGDPLKDITAYARPARVLLGGKVYDPAALRDLYPAFEEE